MKLEESVANLCHTIKYIKVLLKIKYQSNQYFDSDTVYTITTNSIHMFIEDKKLSIFKRSLGKRLP